LFLNKHGDETGHVHGVLRQCNN